MGKNNDRRIKKRFDRGMNPFDGSRRRLGSISHKLKNRYTLKNKTLKKHIEEYFESLEEE